MWCQRAAGHPASVGFMMVLVRTRERAAVFLFSILFSFSSLRALETSTITVLLEEQPLRLFATTNRKIVCVSAYVHIQYIQRKNESRVEQ